MQFHFDVIETEFKNKYQLLYSDTDSMVQNIEHPEIYDWIKNNKQYFDLSDCKRDDLKDYTNNNKLGSFKDELHGEVMIDGIGLNPKVYSFNQQTIDELEKLKIINKKVCKGVSKIVVKK